ncbi:MAG: alanine--glyoxylate aminotransferase family protein [Desulfobacterales bacterium]|jgi:alanine-glyoxylate transaminase/serine-glyoxylate transaminase/serine-pyruvate transaminase|nr:alanine--glyoxylate aminotransferase family protein [Desulfobacterales bacterium]
MTPIDPTDFRDINPGERLLMGPGPSDVPARVLQALAAPCIGHLDPYFLATMNQTQQLLRYLFQTANGLTIPVSATGSAGMEACFANLVECGDEVVVAVNGVFGTRMCDIVQRIGGKLVRVDAEWGRAVDPAAVAAAVKGCRPKVVAVVHAETSTGACTPLEDISTIAHAAGALLLVDCVTSLGGMSVPIDPLQVDAAYSGTQKCLSCPPGLSPVTFSAAAVKALEQRKHPVVSWYLDLSMVRDYWGGDRKYHHTAPVNMVYALREALRLIAEEGLEARFARHRLNHRALVAGLEAMGLAMLVPAEERLPMLNAVRIPEGVNDAKVRQALLSEFAIEIGGGLGQFAGKVWRVGLMGHSCRRRNVMLFLAALETVLKAQGFKARPGAQAAADSVYTSAPA